MLASTTVTGGGASGSQPGKHYYAIDSQPLGVGTFAQVWRAKDSRNGQLVAVKIVRPQGMPELQARLRTEILIHRHIKHDNIVRLLDFWEEGDSCMLAVEYAAGGELFDKIGIARVSIDRLVEPDVGVDSELAHYYFLQLLAGVVRTHCESLVIH